MNSMPLHLILPLSLILSAPALIADAQAGATPSLAKQFDYDRTLPLDVKETARREENGALLRDITYAHADGRDERRDADHAAERGGRAGAGASCSCTGTGRRRRRPTARSSSRTRSRSRGRA